MWRLQAIIRHFLNPEYMWNNFQSTWKRMVNTFILDRTVTFCCWTNRCNNPLPFFRTCNKVWMLLVVQTGASVWFACLSGCWWKSVVGKHHARKPIATFVVARGEAYQRLSVQRDTEQDWSPASFFFFFYMPQQSEIIRTFHFFMVDLVWWCVQKVLLHFHLISRSDCNVGKCPADQNSHAEA